MKKILFLIAACALFSNAHAQRVVAPEPEFINSYCVLTSDSTYDVLPKESGKVEKHQSKFSKFSKIAGAVSDLGFAGGLVGASTGSLSGLETGVRVMGTAAGVGVAAATDYLTFFFSLCLASAVGLLIWINTPRGKRWLDKL